MALSEIEKLERRYAENPQGLTFAPLAEVHRKNGDVQRALDLLKPGLALHPDYIPASIVLGRCHFDLGELQSAETAFTHVLALDGENVIALKSLADINERLLKFDDAERWLNTLLSIDRSNDEAREQLKRVEVSRRQAEVASAAEPAGIMPEAVGGAGAEPVSTEGLEPVATAPAEELAAAWIAGPGVMESRPLDLEVLEPSALRDEAAAPPPGLEPELAPPVADSSEPMADLVGREVDIPERMTDEFQVETSEEIVLRSSGGSEFQVPDASQELFARTVIEPSPFASPPPAPPAPEESRPIEEPAPLWSEAVVAEATGMVPPSEPEVESEAPVEPEPEPAPEPVAEAEPPLAPVMEAELWREPEPVAPPPPPPAPAPFEPPEPEPVVTETMAEVLLQQGHAAEALVVYRELASRSGDPRLRQKIADLEAAQAPPRATRYAAADTGGRSVTAFLQALLAARPPAQAAAPEVRPAPSSDEGAPTRPAAEALSLSSVFGEDATAAPPAVPAPTQERERVSYDDFYGSSSPAQAPRGTRAPEPKKDDLDEFHAWLQNLKR